MRSFPSFPAAILGLILVAVPGPTAAQDAVDRIRLNQIGFHPESPKKAVVVDARDDAFFVIAAERADTVFSGTLGPEATWPYSEERVRIADFSALRTPGSYVVAVPGLGASHPFEIATGVYEEAARAAIKAFYFHRLSTPILPEYAGRWSRPAAHPDDRVLVHASAATDERPEATVISAPRGWYDAGDYNKYIVNSGITTGTLLMLYEHFPDYFAALDLNIPESDNDVPDLLDEILWNLRWMLAMQDPDDGGVYHKLTNARFDEFVMPHEATEPRYVVQKSTTAALDFAAVMAQAARIYDDFEEAYPGLADSARTAALAAWNWARRNPDVLYRQQAMNERFSPAIETGAYGDWDVSDEFRWAAAELYVTTRQDSFLAAHDPLEVALEVPSWSDVGALGVFPLAHHRADLTSAADTARIRQRVLALADTLLAGKAGSAYDVVMGVSARDFVWGSNAVAANQGFVLIQAFRLTKNPAYLAAAQSNLDYLLGRNATGYSFLTGFGDRQVMHPHHRPSEADGVPEPVPGFLSGGPNPGQQDQCSGYPSRLPALSFIDDVCSYASNEVAINWNAPMAYLAGALEALRAPDGLPESGASR